jgi:methylenetetrahydrofolate dehydrogenase (NADP+)/methenyltetrahydrofolate cyclohydrolase
MNCRTLDGTAAAAAIRAEVASEVREFVARTGVTPKLTIVLVGDDPASQVYTRNKAKLSAEAGMAGDLLRLPSETSQAELLGLIGRLNGDASVHGILVQLPLPKTIDEAAVVDAIDPGKDVDGLHAVNAGKLLLSRTAAEAGFVPCTPAGVIELLKRNGVGIAGKDAVVVGRSSIVGKPLALLLLRENATVTIAHSKTRDLARVASGADILVAAIGKTAAIRAEHIKEGAVVVDVGINPVESEAEARELFRDDPARLATFLAKGTALVGDVHPGDARRRASWFTPVPGGVGPMTIAMLLRNTLQAARRDR